MFTKLTVPMAVWLSGNSLALVNVVALRRARWLLGWVTVREYAVLVFNQATQAYTQPGQPSVGRRNGYWRWFQPPLVVESQQLYAELPEQSRPSASLSVAAMLPCNPVGRRAPKSVIKLYETKSKDNSKSTSIILYYFLQPAGRLTQAHRYKQWNVHNRKRKEVSK